MYTRSYKDGGVSLPEGYGGTAFGDGAESAEYSTEPRGGMAEDNSETDSEEVSAEVTSHPGKLPFGGLLSGLFGQKGLHMPRIGTEEILIIAAAVFLFFSDGGDKECSLMLLLLLFI